MSHSPARNSQLPLLLLVILAATAFSKSPPKQAGDADSVASVAVEQGNSGRLLFPSTHRRVRGSSGEKMIGDLRKALDTVDAARLAVVVPKDLVPVAIASQQKQCWNHDQNGFLLENNMMDMTRCKDYEVFAKASKHLKLTAADRANGYEDTWCVTTAYVERKFQKWSDALSAGLYAKHGGAWHLETYYPIEGVTTIQFGQALDGGMPIVCSILPGYSPR